MAVKICKACNNPKDTDANEFHRLSRSVDGFDYYCKQCRNSKALNRYYSDQNENIRLKSRDRQYIYRYGITREDKDTLFVAQATNVQLVVLVTQNINEGGY